MSEPNRTLPEDGRELLQALAGPRPGGHRTIIPPAQFGRSIVTRTPDARMRNVMIASYRFRHEGEQARGYLADAGIGSLLHLNSTPQLPYSDSDRESVRLFVREDNADRARALLSDADEFVFG